MSINDLTYAFMRAGDGQFSTGRSFRTFKELNIPSAGVYVIKIVVPQNVILSHLQVALVSGSMRLETLVGGTEGGTFAESLPKIKINNMAGSPVYVPTVSLTAGGTHTGGTVIDVIRVKSDTNIGRASSVSAAENEYRGIAPGTYYWRFTNLNTDVVAGTFKSEWSEP